LNGKKYGLVFEKHQKAIDEVLDIHTLVLTEEPELLIDHGGDMNFLLEGDNLVRIGLIYIDIILQTLLQGTEKIENAPLRYKSSRCGKKPRRLFLLVVFCKSYFRALDKFIVKSYNIYIQEVRMWKK